MMIHETSKGPSKPDHAKYLGCEPVSGTMQLGTVTANARATSKIVSNSLPTNQSLWDVLMCPTSQITDAAPVVFRIQSRRHRGVRCICFVSSFLFKCMRTAQNASAIQ